MRLITYKYILFWNKIKKLERKIYKTELLRGKLKIFQERTGLNIRTFCAEIDFDPNEFSKIINGHKKNIDAYLLGLIITKYRKANALWFFTEEAEMNRKEPSNDLAAKNEEKIRSLGKELGTLLTEIKSLKDTVSKLSEKEEDEL